MSSIALAHPLQDAWESSIGVLQIWLDTAGLCVNTRMSMHAPLANYFCVATDAWRLLRWIQGYLNACISKS